MSRETLLDDAITKAKEAEDWQLVEWLRMARGGESAARWYTEKLRELEDENARLRSCLSDDAENARMIMAENNKLRKLVCSLHMAYIGALNECEGMDEGLIWEYSGNIDADVAKSKARFEADRHRFDVAMSELGIEVSDG